MTRDSEATATLAACPHCGEVHGEDDLRCPSTDMLLPLEGRRLDGKFRFLSALGSGGMATVYLAINERVDREVAIKFLRPEVGREPEAVARFRSEAKAAGRIGSQHICEILDLGDSPIGPYIVMERLRGIDLAALIRRQGRLAPGYAVRVVRHALEGLAAAHASGIVHRDLKPGNIFLHRTDTDETVVKLMDFGVSKFMDGTGEAQTASGILLGTPEYMAPEQLEGANKLGPTSDIWAMGAILYRAISGHQVFSGPNLAAVIKSMALDEVTPLSKLVEGLPQELEAVIHRCLDRDLASRYQTPEELSEALEPFEELEIEVTPIAEPDRAAQNLPISSIPLQPGEVELLDEPGTERIDPNAPEAAEAKQPRAPTPTADAEPPRDGGSAGRTMLRIVAVVFVIAAISFAITRMLGVDALALARTTFGWELGQPEATTDTKAELAAATGGDTETDGATESGGETDTGGATESSGDTGTGNDTGDETAGGTGTGGGGPWLSSTDRPAPAGTFRADAYITPNEPGPVSDLNSAKQHCQELATRRFAGVGSWGLANPAELSRFVGNQQLKRGRYWTTALHKGRAWAYAMPSGKKNSEKAARKIARPLCVTKY